MTATLKPAILQPGPEASQQLGRVALVMGGDGAEREVSLDGGRAIAAALSNLQVEVETFEGPQALLAAVAEGRIDRVFNLLHGRGGEDGQLQGALDLYGIPFTGSQVLGSATSMDKIASKHLWRGAGIPTPDFALVDLRRGKPEIKDLIEQVGLPLFVKPAREGSSVGMSRVDTADQLAPAINEAARFDPKVLLEAFVQGPEFTVGILENTALPLIRIETRRAFYDYQAKYVDDDTRYLIPAGLDESLEAQIQQLALKAFEVLGGSGWGRADLLLDAQQRPWFIDVNTTPGMTSHSLVPKAAKAIGLDFEQLVWRILLTSVEDQP